jgi:hypothetical protein
MAHESVRTRLLHMHQYTARREAVSRHCGASGKLRAWLDHEFGMQEDESITTG